MGQELNKAWDSVGEEWRHLMSRTNQALTRFRLGSKKGDEDLATFESPRWVLLSTDVHDNSDQLVVEIEAPGLELEDFDINIIEDVLIVSEEKHFEQQNTRGDYRLTERDHGHFSRSIPLNYEVNVNSASANDKKGVMRIELDKVANPKRRHIHVV